MPESRVELKLRVERWLLHGPLWRFIREWDSVKDACNSRALRASYAFLTIIPLLTKAILPIYGTVKIPILDREFEVAIALPFTWWLLFGAACGGSLAGLIYSIRCPSLIKQYPDYPTYEGSKRGTRPLARTVDEVVGTGWTYLIDKKNRPSVMSGQILLEIKPGDPLNSVSGTLIGGRSAQLMKFRDYVPWIEDTEFVDVDLMEGKVTPRLFYFVHDGARRSRPIARAFATVSINVAYFCFLIIAAQSTWTVIRYVVRS